MPIVENLLPGYSGQHATWPRTTSLSTDFKSLTDLHYANSADSRIIEIAEGRRMITVLADE